ncbi:Mu homology domain-containing protein [Syncephalis pseudoplumigaleata]|uniref:Mu homology domain-containing protein n=1 Tax=Syncephalis pseudoplumigaleata TaxID=1712513 RepID=A0A4P9YZX7_9FUNG|nr:Mu homology domain-containing protein [Syncephalis pseudoplumigaleata]|eukprot:RKP25737.1 Mu homology domain-containing protein [Syncephalis pseudoplumigaleata]
MNDHASHVIIEKPLRGVVDRSVVEHFREIVEQQEGGIVEVPPVLRSQRHTFVHLLSDGLTYLTIVDRELSPLLALTFLRHISDIFHDYFGEVTDVIIKDNFVTVMTETSPSGNISSLPWRRADVRYTNNEVYFDIVEEMEVVADSSSCYNIGNHWHIDHYDHASYAYRAGHRLAYAHPLPVLISPKLRINKDTESRLEVSLLTRQTGGKAIEATRLMVPLPSHATNIHMIYWDAGNISNKERLPLLTATFNCPEDTRRTGYTAQLEFRIDGYAASGLRVNGLALHGESYHHFKGLRSITKSGRYHLRF